MSKTLRGLWKTSQCILLCTLCKITMASSFDCGRASKSIEKLICLDYRLSDLDSELVEAYNSKLVQSSVNLNLLTSQRKWIVERNRCKSFACVRDAYINRLFVLSPSAAEIYAPMRAPSSKRWEYVAPEGYTLDGEFIINGRPLTEQRGPFGTGRIDWVLLDEGKTIPREFTDRLPPYEQSLTYERTIDLGRRLVVSTVGPSMCMTGVGGLGLKVDGAMNHLGSKKLRILVALIREEWTNSEPSGNCFEVDLNHRRASFSQSTVAGGSMYWLDKKFSIRFDQQLWTQSALVGKKVFLMWGSNLAAMIDPHCKTYDRECADKQFEKLLNQVSSFY